VFAAQPIKQGSLLAAIPLDLALPVNAGDLLVSSNIVMHGSVVQLT
jgi:hypothetical protein